MIEPGHHLVDVCRSGALRHCWALDHDHRNAALASGVDFGAGAVAAGIAGDEDSNVLVAHQGKIAVFCERPAGDDDLGVRQGQIGTRLIDEAQQITVLRPGGERREMLAADGKEDGCRFIRESSDSVFEVGDSDPVVAIDGRPGGADESDQWRCGFGAGGDGILAHGIGEGVGRIDDMSDGCIVQVGGETFGAAVSPGAHGERLVDGNLGAARIGIDRVKARIGDGACQRVGVTCSAEYEDAGHG